MLSCALRAISRNVRRSAADHLQAPHLRPLSGAFRSEQMISTCYVYEYSACMRIQGNQ
jgi:hypothetical protein